MRIDCDGGARRMRFVRQQHGGRHRDADFRRERVVEEFVVGAPPERIVDHRGSGEHGVLQIGAIERDVVRDAVDDDAVARGLGHLDAADVDVLGV